MFCGHTRSNAPPEVWVPAKILAPLYDKLQGHKVAASTIENGQTRIAFSVRISSSNGEKADIVANYKKLYPWACANQDNKEVPGSPPTHGQAIARYWKVLWARLHDEQVFKGPLLSTYFTGGTPYNQPRDAKTPDSWVSFVMPWGLKSATINNKTVVVTGPYNKLTQVKIHVYYGNNSHLINIKPLDDWSADTVYKVTVSPPISSWNDQPLQETLDFVFSTKPEDLKKPANNTSGSGGCSFGHHSSNSQFFAFVVALLLGGIIWFTQNRSKKNKR